MSFLTIFLIAVGLSMDCFAVSIASSSRIVQLKIKHAFRIALFFGGFQALMPIIGWFAGVGMRSFIAGVDHWIAFGLLAAIGGKMVYESFGIEKSDMKDPTNFAILIALSVATSIDALAIGVSLSFLQVAIATPAIIIGCVTFMVSFAGVYIGKVFGHFFEKYIEMAGGLVLIGIGAKILIQHLA